MNKINEVNSQMPDHQHREDEFILIYTNGETNEGIIGFWLNGFRYMSGETVYNVTGWEYEENE